MTRLGGWVLLVLMTLGVGGCTWIGRDYNQQIALRIQDGKTTKAEIQEWLGTPHEMGLEGGYETWTYRYIWKMILEHEQSKELKIYFRENGVVHTTAYTTSNPEWRIKR